MRQYTVNKLNNNYIQVSNLIKLDNQNLLTRERELTTLLDVSSHLKDKGNVCGVKSELENIKQSLRNNYLHILAVEEAFLNNNLFSVQKQVRTIEDLLDVNRKNQVITL